MQKAKENGIDAINIVVNGITIEVDVNEFKEDTMLNISKVADSVADNATDKKRVSDVYNFEFTTTDGRQVNRFNKPVKVSVPVDVTGVADPEYLVFVKIVDGEIIPYGGKYNSETGTFDAQRSSFSTYTVIENKVVFKDIASVQSWAGHAIGVTAAKGIVNGKAEGVFAPIDNVTRAEFVKLIVDTFGLSIGQAQRRSMMLHTALGTVRMWLLQLKRVSLTVVQLKCSILTRRSPVRI